MNIIVSRNGQQFGPYTLEQVNAYLASGQLLSTDLGWYEGASQWTPLRTIEGIAVPAPPPPPPPGSQRNLGKLILMAIVWCLVFWIGGLIVAGAIAGVSNPKDAATAGQRAGESLGVLFFLVSVCLSIALTAAGKLPGTKKTKF